MPASIGFELGVQLLFAFVNMFFYVPLLYPNLLIMYFYSGIFYAGHNKVNRQQTYLPSYLRWPHMQADQVRGLSLREIGGGFSKHHRAPSIRNACYAIAKASTMVQKMQNVKKLRGHRDAVYCGTFIFLLGMNSGHFAQSSCLNNITVLSCSNCIKNSSKLSPFLCKSCSIWVHVNK